MILSCPQLSGLLYADGRQILNFCYLAHVWFAYPETKNLTLEETAKVFDGDKAAVARLNLAEVKKELEMQEAIEHVEPVVMKS